MTPASNEDPRPKERFLWIEEFRKVKPVILAPPKPQPTGASGTARTREITSGLEVYTGPWGEPEARHLLSRTLFGVKKSELSLFRGLTLEEAVDRVVMPSPTPAPPVNDYNGLESAAVDPHVALGQSWLEAPHAGQKEGYRVVSLKTWLIRNVIAQEPTIHEKMILFWSNLLVTKVWDVYIAKTSYQYFDMLRNFALGNYKSLIRALTLDPSMLIFLNGASNTKEAPDENYARELQELFCIGKGRDSHYTEGDVQAAANVLTGWVVSWDRYNNPGPFTSSFQASRHNAADKQFSAFYGNRVITGKTGAEGANELDELLEMIIHHEETSRYICRRLYSFFVYNEISDAVEANMITPMADIFRNSNYEIAPVLKALFKSSHFYDSLNRGVLIKSPADHLLGIWRTLGVTSPDESNPTLNYGIRRSMHWHMAVLGMELGDPPNVAGWAGYYQSPQYDKAWITAATITTRAVTTDSLLYWGFWISSTLKINADVIGFVSGLENPSDPNALLAESAALLLGLELPQPVLGNLKSILLSGQQSDHYWSSAWLDYTTNPGDQNKKMIVQTRLQSTFQRLLQLGEYHLM